MPRVGSSRLVVTALAGLAALAGCAPQPPPPAELVSLSIRSAASELPRGRTTRVAAIATYSDGSAAVVTNDAEWSSAAPKVAAFDATGQRGTVRAADEGKAELVARYQGLEASAPLAVTPHVVDALRIERDGAGVLPRGVDEQLRAVAVYSDGFTAEVTTAALWRANTEAISVDPQCAGRVIAAEEGKGLVRAFFDGASSETTFEVTAAVVAKVEIDPPAPSLAHGTELELSATAIYTDGTTADVTATAEWALSDPAVVAWSEGRLHGTAPGNAKVTAQFGGVSTEAEITVTPAELTGISLTPPLLVMPQGTHARFTAVAHFTDGSVQDLSAQSSWSSSDPAIADLIFALRKGEIAALAVGTADVRAAFGGFEAVAHVTVNGAQLVSMQVLPTTPSVAQGNTLQLQAIGTWSDSSSADLSAQVAWSSNDPSIASIDADGKLHGLAQGEVTLTATYQGLQPTAVVTVTAPTVNSIALVGGLTSMPRGTAVTLTALGTFSDGHVEDVSSAAVWSSTNPVVASISNAPSTRGVVTALDEGLAQLQASFNGVTGTVGVEVTPAVVDHLELSPGSLTAPLGETVSFSATQVFTDGSRVPLAGLAQWTTSAPAIATVDPSGNVFTANEGTAVVTVTDGTHSVSGVVEVTPAALKSLSLSQSSLSLPLGTAAALTATAHWTDGATQDVTANAVWTTDDVQIAQFNGTGLVQTVAAGQTQLGVSWSGLSTTARIEVTPAAVVSVEMSPAGAAIGVGQSLPLTASAMYTDGHLEDVTAQANWASTDTTVATVSQGTAGWTVTGVSAGGVELRVYFSGFVGSAFFTVQ